MKRLLLVLCLLLTGAVAADARLMLNQLNGFGARNAVEACTSHDYDNTVLLNHYEGADGATTITDSSASAHSPSVTATAEIDNAQFKLGDTSLLLGSGGLLTYSASTDWEFGTGDLTIDVWIRITSNSAEIIASDGGYYDATDGQWVFRTQPGASTPRLNFSWEDSVAGLSSHSTADNVISLNTWHWVGVTIESGTIKFWLDGSQVGTNGSITQSIGVSGAGLKVGTSFGGHMDELRIVKGSAEDLTTVPTLPYCDS